MHWTPDQLLELSQEYYDELLDLARTWISPHGD